MTASATPLVGAPRRLGRRLLRSPLVDLLAGPHGIDRYLELLSPSLTVAEARAEVVTVRRQTSRSVTLSLRPNAAWPGFRAGQFVRVGVEIDGVRRTRTYSPACSECDDQLEVTVTTRNDGTVSRHLRDAIRPGAVLHLSNPEGEFVLPGDRPKRLHLISGGSGITPHIAMRRTLCEEGHDGEILFLHYARTPADFLYADEVHRLAAGHPGVRVAYRATRGPEAGPRLDAAGLAELGNVDGEAVGAVCGPPPLLEAARRAWVQLGGSPARLLEETFTPPRLSVTGEAAEGTLRFLRSERRAAIGTGTLLEQAEAAGLSPDFGCRMGICHTCTCRKAAGAVRNLRTGEISAEEDEDIQLCVSVPAGDVALDI
jgi:ferredoxin-NADP reductase